MDSEIITLGKGKYITGATIVGSISQLPQFQSKESPTHIPVTIINAFGESPLSHTWIQNRLDELSLMDDVISTSFTEHIILRTSEHGNVDFVKEKTTTKFYVESAHDIPRDGPYFLDGKTLHKAYRLYEDSYNAFVCGVVQSEEKPLSFKQFQTEKCIPVPSRCYFPVPTNQRPLSGKRIAVKDIYDLRGVPTAAGCKGYGAYHGPAQDTAECIQALLDRGAVIVAKAKTVQFASGMASADWCVNICPTNPRGDGQLDTDCSSSGSAAAVAGYGWLDFAIGSDSLGSMTGPAAACGIFGLRPSLGALSNVGAVPVSTYLDTPGHFSRSISDLSKLAGAWLKPLGAVSRSPAFDNKPTAILVPRESQEFHIDSKISALNGFVRDLEIYSGVAHTSFSINDLWREHSDRPHDAPSLTQYLQNTVAHIQLHDCWQNASRFLEAYSEEEFGKIEIDPLIRYKWELGRKVTEREYENAMERRGVFRDFMERKVFTEGTVLVMPGGDTNIRFRDEKTSESQYDTWQGFGLQNTTYSVLGCLPAVSIPVGQRSYQSKLTGETANQPVSVMVLGPRGTDTWLLKHLDNALREKRRTVRVGSDTF